MDPRQNQDKDKYRNYQNTTSTVANTYQMMHQQQTAESINALRNQFIHSDGQVVRKRLADLFPILETIIDDSDPDTRLKQIYHAYQTGEALKLYCDPADPKRLKQTILIADLFGAEWATLPPTVRTHYPQYLHELYPEIEDWSWLPLVGFLHDMGKILASTEWGALPQCHVVGDTFPIDAPFASSNLFYEQGFYKTNPNLTTTHETSTQVGKYERHCGFTHLTMSFGHDDYMFLILNNAIHRLPPHALYIIRFHSFYPWHTPRNGERGYMALANENDWRLLPLLKAFQQSDLYSKTDSMPNTAQLEEEYVQRMEYFIPGRLQTRYNLRPAQLKMSHLEKETLDFPSSKQYRRGT